MEDTAAAVPGVRIEAPGRPPAHLTELLLDFSGTLALDGVLLPGVADMLTALASQVRITVVTADTFGRAHEALQGLPLTVRIVETGAEKVRLATELGTGNVVAIGNGRNDVPMFEAAALRIAVMGPEGAAGELLRAADVVATDIRSALGLLMHPLRLKATLRH